MNLYPPTTSALTGLRHNILGVKIPVVFGDDGIHVGGIPSVLDAEMGHPPFWLAMTMQDKYCPDAREITHFKNYGYHESVSVTLKLRFMNSSLHYPGS
jgi:hypothetical protein